MMPVDSDERSGMIMEGPSDPDAQATVTDFIDYTEYLPADLVRSLTLIRGLDETYLQAEATVHELTKVYGALSFSPESESESKLTPIVLRKRISQHLSRAMNAREAAYAEASRLYDLVDRHFDRLSRIKSKLDALLESFDADSLAAQALAAAEAKRDRKAEERAALPRLTLRFDPSRRQLVGADKGRRATRTDRIRFDPDMAIASTEHSGAEEEPKATPAAAPKKKDAAKRGKPNRRKTQPTGATALEMSTAHALATLDPPPEDAVIGSEHLPWLRLSDWEMAKLRKKMKKNNLWQPSEIMINRELALRGRGWENYRAAKIKAEAEGTELLDCDDVTNNFIADTLLRKGEAGPDGAPVVDRIKLSNRGMKLNEAKKLKRENLAREQAALAAAEAEMAAKRLGDIGSTFKSLFSSPAEQSPSNCAPSGFFGASSPSTNNANGIPSKDRTKAKPPSKKRKLEETATQDATTQQQQPQQEEPVEPASVAPIAVSSATKPGAKRTKPNKDQAASGATTPTTIKLTLTTGGAPLSKKSTPVQSPVETKRSSRRLSAASKAQPTPTPPVTRTQSRRTSMSGVEPPGRELRRKSATPAAARAQAQDQAQPAPRRSKRPAPGPVTAGQDGGAAVSVGRRKAKPTPRKKREHPARGGSQPQQDIRIDEDGVLEEIDANEPRYCLCGDVSFGTMICCEDNDCDKEWFHLECVGLSDIPSRTAKWFCPDCRKKNNIAAIDGIVRKTGRR